MYPFNCIFRRILDYIKVDFKFLNDDNVKKNFQNLIYITLNIIYYFRREPAGKNVVASKIE